jgi:hypothetical protein
MESLVPTEPKKVSAVKDIEVTLSTPPFFARVGYGSRDACHGMHHGCHPGCHASMPVNFLIKSSPQWLQILALHPKVKPFASLKPTAVTTKTKEHWKRNKGCQSVPSPPPNNAPLHSFPLFMPPI